MIKAQYIALIQQYDVAYNTTEELWNEIERYYSENHRHYHNLQHIEALSNELATVKNKIQNWEVILFTLYYHDIIYKSTKKDNEEKSAELAAKRMREIGVEQHCVELCQKQIIATKSHSEHKDSDTNYFTDADLSILGKEPTQYQTYCSNIRKEYSIYPYFLYKRGRKKVVNHFLAMDKIFKTEEFFTKYEAQARRNLTDELSRLNK